MGQKFFPGRFILFLVGRVTQFTNIRSRSIACWSCGGIVWSLGNRSVSSVIFASRNVVSQTHCNAMTVDWAQSDVTQ